MGQPVTSPKFERRTLYADLREIAKRMGKEEAFTEGRDAEAWLQFCCTRKLARRTQIFQRTTR